MKLAELENSCQVRDPAGRLIATFPTAENARAFLTGYESGVRDGAERVARRVNELIAELKGMVQ
jgi:hypothetical protein